ncbi:hypothetical protein C7447_10151 [Tenacibaculum adriaticum]|uniref:Cytochrome c n=1 Tax=Tenacibaculum adriaticum TaxID=413713 RepID=A0A5S5DUH7_9FLAO|nr:hypothetical protein [Tenacibaculum adriaticum]TYP99455.1 hypothetical protein C7447_10151 [Tenacibaculum adriaticum]
MNKRFIIFIAFILLVSCQNKKATKKIKVINEVPANFEMYKTSEMAGLMRTMLAKNKELRQQIINGEEIGDFNEAYLKIHTEKLTDSSDLDETFPTFAKHFADMQKEIFEVSSAEQKEQFNRTVDACIACHKDRCTGPIPRIEKLRIH